MVRLTNGRRERTKTMMLRPILYTLALRAGSVLALLCQWAVRTQSRAEA